MATFILENFPEDLLERLEKLARREDRSMNEQIIAILRKATEKVPTPPEFLVSPETDPTWQERRAATAKILDEIEQRRQHRSGSIEWLDSTVLLREDRDNR